MTIQAAFQNGNKEITATITGHNEWSVDDKARVYFDIEFDRKRSPIHKLYEVVKGGTRDATIEVEGRVFGYELSGCDSNVKRREATAAVKSLVEQIVAGSEI